MPEYFKYHSNFKRIDESKDRLFYDVPRLVIHVDVNASKTLANYFNKHVPKESIMLDLMSSFSSHLPNKKRFKFVCGLGLNEVELKNNHKLSTYLIHDINLAPNLPFNDSVFDSCLISFSIQYVVNPLALITSLGRVLMPNAMCYVAFSNRMFPTKAVAIWQAISNVERGDLIKSYFNESKLFHPPKTDQLVTAGQGYDPLSVVRAKRK